MRALVAHASCCKTTCRHCQMAPAVFRWAVGLGASLTVPSGVWAQQGGGYGQENMLLDEIARLRAEVERLKTVPQQAPPAQLPQAQQPPPMDMSAVQRELE